MKVKYYFFRPMAFPECSAISGAAMKVKPHYIFHVNLVII